MDPAPHHILTRLADTGSGFYSSDSMVILGVTLLGQVLVHFSNEYLALYPLTPMVGPDLDRILVS